MSTPSELNEIEQSIVDNVAKHGCFIMSVFDPDGEEPDFSYSIGFEHTAGQGEVIVFALPKDLRISMINEIRAQIGAGGLELVDGVAIQGLLEGYDCVAREIADMDAIREHFGSAIWFNRRFGPGEMNRAFQIVWPGAQQGLLPWDEGCSQSVIGDQPPLYERTVH